MQRIKRLYLSWRTDQDLIALYQNTSPKIFNKAVKESLRLVFRKGYKTSFFYELETDPSWPVSKAEEDLVLALSFSNKDDIEIWEALNDAKKLRASSIIKMSLRFALGSAYVIGSCLNTERMISNPSEVKEICYIAKPVRRRRSSVKRTQTKTVVVREVVETEGSCVATSLEEGTEQIAAPVNNTAGMGGFSLPGLGSAPSFGAAPAFGSEPQTAAEDDSGEDFSDDDILSMLDNM